MTEITWHRMTSGPNHWPEANKEVLILHTEINGREKTMMMTTGRLLPTVRESDRAVFVTSDGRKILLALEWTELPIIPEDRQKLKDLHESQRRESNPK